MPDSHIFHIGYWINLILALLTGLLNGFKDDFGLYNPPSAAPVPFDAARGGRWSEKVSTPLIGAAATNLPDGKILIWSSYERMEFSQPDLGDRGKTRTAIMDPVTASIVEEEVKETNHDMLYVFPPFAWLLLSISPLATVGRLTSDPRPQTSCPGTAYLPDGRVMITGGTSTPRVTFFDPITKEWTNGRDMILGRGYHSMTLLGGMSCNRSSALLHRRRRLMFTFTFPTMFVRKPQQQQQQQMARCLPWADHSPAALATNTGRYGGQKLNPGLICPT
jgi:hypothetical protein